MIKKTTRLFVSPHASPHLGLPPVYYY